MNKDEMIENIADYIQIASDLYRIECIKVAKYLVENKNCRMIAEDEIVVKKSEYEKLSKDYATINNEAYYCGFSAGAEEATKETVKAILTTIYNRLRCVTFKQTDELKIVKDLANELGIELED